MTSVTYNFKPGPWLGTSYAYAKGGRTAVKGASGSDLQHNGRVGATLALPVSAPAAVKITHVNGLVMRLGGDFDSLGAIQCSWR